jgi:hypothetical protein
MSYKITCPFTLISSHKIEEVGFRGGNNIRLTIPFKIDTPLGFTGINLEIDQLEEDKYNIVIISNSLDTKEKQVRFLEKISEYISFLINRKENNPQYGSIFVNIEWFDFKAILLQEDSNSFLSTAHLTDFWEISSTRPVTISHDDLSSATYNDLLQFYFNGLRAEHKKSKYFHWFLILEYLEKSGKYKNLFNDKKLFDEVEEQEIKNVAEKMNDPVKKGVILNLLSRTKEFRNTKLLKMINCLEITNYNSIGKHVEITEEIVKTIINGRNALFHSGTKFPEPILWEHLFPLVTLIVEHVSKNAHALDT